MSHFNQRMLYGIAPPSKKEEEIKPFIADLYGINEPEEIKESIPSKNYPKEKESKPEPGDINFSKQSHEELYNKAFILAKKLITVSIKDDFRLKKELINKIASILFVNETTSILGEDRLKGCINLAEEIINNLFSD